jgi:hypothetical protein
MKENPKFTAWSKKWKNARKEKDTKRILVLWSEPLPKKWEREVWEGDLGFRKNNEGRDKGEQLIERQLFGNENGLIFSDGNSDKRFRLKCVYQNMPLVNQKKGQVIADAFGLLEIGKKRRPLFIEIKTTDQNPWFALVENLQQVHLARACARRIQKFVKQPIERGIWGLVLAPEKYFSKKDTDMKRCKELLERLKDSTTARIALGISDSLKEGHIRIIASNWANC